MVANSDSSCLGSIPFLLVTVLRLIKIENIFRQSSGIIRLSDNGTLHNSLCLGTSYHLCCAFARIRWHSQDMKQNIIRRL